MNIKIAKKFLTPLVTDRSYLSWFHCLMKNTRYKIMADTSMVPFIFHSTLTYIILVSPTVTQGVGIISIYTIYIGVNWET